MFCDRGDHLCERFHPFGIHDHEDGAGSAQLFPDRCEVLQHFVYHASIRYHTVELHALHDVRVLVLEGRFGGGCRGTAFGGVDVADQRQIISLDLRAAVVSSQSPSFLEDFGVVGAHHDDAVALLEEICQGRSLHFAFSVFGFPMSPRRTVSFS